MSFGFRRKPNQSNDSRRYRSFKETVQYLKNKLTIGCIIEASTYYMSHKYAIEYCKSKVDKLFVLLNSDDSIKKYMS